jgi:acetyltransferase-like isoleucine patch superfamily enzyme
VGFTVDAGHLDADSKHGLPVVPFEDLERLFPPSETAVIAPLGRNLMRGLAAGRLQAAKRRGYRSISYVSSRAMTWPDLMTGDGCMIHDGVTIEPFASIGDTTNLLPGCHLGHHVSIAGSCFMAPRVILAGRVRVEERTFIGICAIVHSGVRIARGCLIAAGVRVNRDTDEDGIYEGAGNPPGRARPQPEAGLAVLPWMGWAIQVGKADQRRPSKATMSIASRAHEEFQS